VILRDYLTPFDLARVSVHFRWDVGSVETRYGPGDGPGNVRGSTNKGRISLDSADVPMGTDGKLDLRDPRALETVLHELIHCDQHRRGWLYRLKMAWWRTVKAYDKRPHEIEATTQARAWAQS
jgi:hypothetical protein